MIEHKEHFEGICEKTISRAAGFINNGLLSNFKKIYIIHYKSIFSRGKLINEGGHIRIENIIKKYKKYLKKDTIEIVSFNAISNYEKLYSLHNNNQLETKIYEKTTLCIFIDSNFILRTDFLPKTIQYFNFLINNQKNHNLIIRSDVFISNNSGNLLAALDGETIPQKPYLSNPFRALVAISLKNLISINIDKLKRQKNQLGLSILSNLNSNYNVFSLPSILCKLNINEVEINNYAESFLYGLSDEEAKYLEEQNKSIALKSYEIKTLRAKNLDFCYRLNLPPEKPNLKRKQINIFSIIPFRDNLEITINCIKHFKNSNIEVNLKTVLVDNGSKDCQLLNKIKVISDYYLYSKDEYNFSNLNNIGFSLIKKDLDLNKDYLLLLNNDCLISQDALKNLLSAINISNSIAAAGGKLFYPNGKIQHGGVGITRKKPDYAPHKLYHIDAHKDSQDSIASKYPFFADGCTAACLLIRANVYKKINGFKSDICPSAHSDSYLYNSIRKLGKYIIYEPKANAIHYESYSRNFYYPDDLESYIAFSLLKSEQNKGLLSKEIINFG